MKYASFGSISHGTLKNEDLLSAFAGELEYHMKRQTTRFPRRALRKLVNKAYRLALTDPESEEANHTLEKLFDALERFAPPYTYFGAIDGDGSDFGYWSAIDGADFDGLRVSDLCEVPAGYRGEVLHVNDHGNMSLYVATRRGLKEIWAVV